MRGSMGDSASSPGRANEFRCRFERVTAGTMLKVCDALTGDHLVTLELWSAGLQPTDMATLAKALRHNATLLTLELGGNSALKDTGVRELAPGLRSASALSCLGLDSIGMGDGGAAALAAVLRGGSALAVLKLQRAFGGFEP